MNKKIKMILEALGAGLFGALVMFLFEPAGVTSVVTNFLVLSLGAYAGLAVRGLRLVSDKQTEKA